MEKKWKILVLSVYTESWAASLTEKKLPSLSFRNKEWTDAEKWQKTAKTSVMERLAIPDIGGTPKVNVKKKYNYDGLQVEELTWQLPYGRPTEAILLKPENAGDPYLEFLPSMIMADNKYFGTRKITKINDNQHPLIKEHQKNYYERPGMGQ